MVVSDEKDDEEKWCKNHLALAAEESHCHGLKGVPGLECRTVGWLVSPAEGHEKNFWTPPVKVHKMLI